jgi:hypothetical protein
VGLPLRITVTPKPGESLNSVLARASHANGEEWLGRFLSLVDRGTVHPGSVAFAELDFAGTLAELLSIDPSALRALFHPTCARENRTRFIDWYGTPLPRYLIETEVRRYSPSSLRRAGYHRAQWMIRPLEFCCESLELLKPNCPHCGATLGWKKTRGISLCEQCGGSLQHHNEEQLNPEYRADAVAAAQLLSPTAQTRWRALQRLPAPFCAWEPGDVFLAGLGFGKIFSTEPFQGASPPANTGRAPLFPHLPTADLVKGYRLLRGWPTSVAHAVSKVVLESRDDQNLLPRFLRGICVRATQLPRDVRELVLGQLADLSLPREIPVKCDAPAQDSASINPNLVSGTEAPRACATGEKRPARRRQDKRHGVRNPRRRRARLFYNDQPHRAFAILRAARRETDVCQLTGAIPYCLGALADRGLLVAVSDHDALLTAETRLYRIAPVRRLRQKLCEIPVRAEKKTRCVDVLRGQFHPESAAHAIEALLDGRLHLVRRDENDRPILKRCWVDEAEAKEFAKAIRPNSPPEGTVSCADAGRILGLPKVRVDCALQLGLIQGRRVTAQLTLVTLESLLAFDSDFVSRDELAGMLGIHPRTVSERMRMSGLSPRVRLYKMPLWDRADVEILVRSSAPEGNTVDQEQTPLQAIDDPSGTRLSPLP